MEIPAFPVNPSLCPEVLDLLEDHPQGMRPSRGRQAALMEEALVELERFGPLLEVRLGQVLAPLVRGGHKHLGYVTPAVFCREELGISATAAWDAVHLAEGLGKRPILRQAFLEGRLPRTHALELLRLDSQEDAAWVARAAAMSVQELRRACKPLRSSSASEDKETSRVRTFDLEAEPYATWLAAVELARRREGRDLGPANVLEQILAEFAAARPLDVPSPFQRDPRWGTTVPAAASDLDSEVAAPIALPLQCDPRWNVTVSAAALAAGSEDAGLPLPSFQRDPRWPITPPAVSPDAGGDQAGSVGEAPQAAGEGARPSGEASDPGGTEAGSCLAKPEPGGEEALPPPELHGLLREALPRSPRKLTFLARRLLVSRVRLELQHGRILRRVQEGRLYREAGRRSYRAWLTSRGIAPSTAFQATARDQRLEKHGLLRQALSEGRLAPAKVDLLLRLPRRADVESWAAYAEEHTCRRLEDAVEAALVLASRFPATWTHRRGSAPREEETLDDFRRQAGLQGFEATFEDLAQAFDQAESKRSAPETVQTSAAPAAVPGPTSGAATPTEEPDPGSRPLAATCEGGDALGMKARLPGASSRSAPAGPEASQPPSTIRLRLVLPESLDRLLLAAEATLRGDAEEPLTPEECLYVLCLVFLRQAGSEDSRQGRVRRQALERAGYRCEVPGCACRTNLHVHHIQRRSQGGSDELENLAVVCSSHHLRHLHGGTMRVEGEDPSTRIWEIGLQEGEPWRVWCDERLVDGEALAGEAVEAESPPGEDPVCEAVPEYRCGPLLPPPGTRVA
nr:HNH endonuclease signature motif containing protein [Methanocorpusculum sp. GPch4]